jgi:hypothetical protein
MKKLFAAWTLAAVLFAPSMASIATDAFTDTNGTNLNAHTMTSGGLTWDEVGSCLFDIQSNKAAHDASSVTGNCMATIDASDASVANSVDIAVPNATDYAVGIVTRFSDASNYWFARVVRSGGGTPQTEIYDITAGAYDTSCDTDNTSAISGTTITLGVTTNGDTINLYIGGVLASTCTTASFNNTATKHGIMHYTDGTYVNTSTWDNWSTDSDPGSIGGGGGGATINPAILNNPVRGGGLLGLAKGVLRVQ